MPRRACRGPGIAVTHALPASAPPAASRRSAPSFGSQPPSAPIDSAQGAAYSAGTASHAGMDPNPADVSRAVAAASGANAAPLSNVTNTYTSGIDSMVLQELQQSTRANQRKRGGSKAKWSKQEVRRRQRARCPRQGRIFDTPAYCGAASGGDGAPGRGGPGLNLGPSTPCRPADPLS